MPRMWTATLKRDSPRYTEWQDILRSQEVPIQNPKASEAQLGPESAMVYKLDLDRLDKPQLDRLIVWIADRFGCKPNQARAELESNGC